MVEAQAGVLQAQEAPQLLGGNLEEALEVLGGLALGNEGQRANGGIPGRGGRQHPQDRVAQALAALVLVRGRMPVALGGQGERPSLHQVLKQGGPVLDAGGAAMNSVADEPFVPLVGHHQGARQDQLLEHLEEALDEAGGVVVGGVEAGQGVPQGGLHQALLQGLGELELDGFHGKAFLGQLGRRPGHPGWGGLGGQGFGDFHHVVEVPALHEEAVGPTGLGPEASQAGALGGEQQDRQVAGGAVVLEEAAELVAVQEGHHAVAHHHVRRL